MRVNVLTLLPRREVERLSEHVEDLQKLNQHLMTTSTEHKESLQMHQQKLMELNREHQVRPRGTPSTGSNIGENTATQCGEYHREAAAPQPSLLL